MCLKTKLLNSHESDLSRLAVMKTSFLPAPCLSLQAPGHILWPEREVSTKLAVNIYQTLYVVVWLIHEFSVGQG